MAPRKVVMAAFNQGAVPTIACINKATVELGVDFDKLIPALQTFLDECFVPVWGTPAKLVKAAKPVSVHGLSCFSMMQTRRTPKAIMT